MNKTNRKNKNLLFRALVISVKGERTYSTIIALLTTVIMLVVTVFPAWAVDEQPLSIERFERYNPVHTETVNPGTSKENLNLPGTLRAVVSLSELGLDAAGFVQAEPAVDMLDGYEHYDYYYYGYVAPKDVADIYTAGELAIYSILYANGEVAHRVYGSVNGSENMWFSCDEAGVINGVLVDIPVVWESADYDKDTAGEYVFTASFSGYSYKGEKPFAQIFVQDIPDDDAGHGNEQEGDTVECTCSYGKNEASDEHEEGCLYFIEKEDDCTCDVQDGEEHAEECPLFVRVAENCHCGLDGEAIDEENFPWGHQEDCIHFSPIECMCREMIEVVSNDTIDGLRPAEESISLAAGEFTHIHDSDNIDCPLFGNDTVRILKLATDEESVMIKTDAEFITDAIDLPYPALGRIEIIEGSVQPGKAHDSELALLSGNGGGANDVNQDNYMLANTKTSGNASYSSQYTDGLTIPGTWIDYVNTIWMNKAFNKFAWTPAESTGAFNDWSFLGFSADQTSGTVTTNQRRMPSKSGSTWTVYSGEQYRFALFNMSNGDTISLGGNLNMNGNAVTWNSVVMNVKKNLIIAGNNYKIYNLGLFQNATISNHHISCMVSSYMDLMMTNIEFVTAKMVSSQPYTGLFRFPDQTDSYTQVVTMRNAHIKDSMIYSSSSIGTISPFGVLVSSNNSTNINTRTAINNCTTSGGYIYGADHVSGFVLGVGNYHNSYPSSFPATSIYNCFSVDNLICGTGAHSAGFTSCVGGRVLVDDCFTANEIYGSAMTSGFVGFPSGTYTNCYSTGKLEGYMRLAGFGWDAGQTTSGLHWSKYYNNCYSTTLVGLRTKGSNQGGFAMMEGVINGYFKITMKDCYSAGEVGNYDIDMNAPKNIGGFMSHSSELNRYVMSNCYYDKQTSAMREWVAGDIKSATGVTGVLTTTTAKGGTGLASGSYGTTGFTGFSDNKKWVYTAEHYPQLDVFANASFGAWGNSARANLVKAYSLASTSTVMLDTWDDGYDWNDDGVRTVGVTSYDRTLTSTGKADHKGNQYTYDTVREIISPFTVTNDANYSHMIGSGAPSEQVDSDGSTTSLTNTVVIDDVAKTGVNENPGMDWYKISAIRSGQLGYRPIRLIGYMSLEAGQNQAISCGQKYDHRPDVELNMMDTLTDNLVVGMDDSKIWSSSVEGGYPDSPKYYALRTANMETDFSASEDAWIYTEIWRAAQDTNGSYVQDTANQYGYIDGTDKLVPDISVRVTGAGTGSGTTLAEQKWNGEIPINPSSAIQQKYIIIYYWMLSDGRYATDYKVITLDPAEYDLMVDVLTVQNGDKNDPVNTNSLFLGTGEDNATGDPAYVLSSSTDTHDETLDIGFGRNATAAWKKVNKNVDVIKTQIDLYADDEDETSMGTGTVYGSLVKGSTITIPTKYFYDSYEYDSVQGQDREVTKMEVLNIDYTVAEKEVSGVGTGEYYLRFNKLANVPSSEAPPAIAGTNDTTGIPGTANAYINDMQFNTEITLWVTGGMEFSFIKIDEKGNRFVDGEVEFQLYSCGHEHDSDCGGSTDPDMCNHIHEELASDASEANGCWVVSGPTVLTRYTDDYGFVSFENLFTGDYILAETSTVPGYQLPVGQWLIHIDSTSQTYSILARGETPPAFIEEFAVLKLPNYPVMTFPPTGGIGTIRFTVTGIALVGFAVMLIVTSKRKKGV